MINFDVVEKEIELLYKQGKYKEIVEKLKFIKHQSEGEGKHEYEQWSLKKHLGHNEIPLNRLIDITDGDDLPAEEKLDLLLDWECISKNMAFEYLEKDLIPVLLDSKSIKGFLNRYCYLLGYVLLEKNQASKDTLLNAEHLINNQIFDDFDRGHLLKEVIIIMHKLRFDKECITMLDTYSEIIPQKEGLCILLASSSDDVDIIEKSIVILKHAINKKKEGRESQDLLPRVCRYRDKVFKYLKNQTESVEMQLSSNNIKDNLPDPNVIECIYDFVRNYESGKYEIKSPIYAEQFLRSLLLQDIIRDINLVEEGRAIVDELNKREALNKQLSDTEALEQNLSELEERYYYLLLEKLSKDTNSILHRMKDRLDVPFNDAASLVEKCFDQKTFRILKQNEHVMRYLNSAEWVWSNNEHMASMGQYKIDNGQDLTFLVCGYCKAVETFLYYFVINISKRFEIKHMEIDKEKVEIKSIKFEHSTLAVYNKFIYDNKNRCFIKTHRADKVNEQIGDWIQKYRNAHFHKDAVIEYDKAQEIRDKSIELLELLTKELNLNNNIDEF